MRKLVMAAAALVVPLMATPALADAHMEASEPEIANKDWYNVVFIDFHSGKTGEALDLIKEFVATDIALGRTPPMMLSMNTGEYDVMVVFHMREGIAAMGWENNPAQAEWNAKFVERMGSEEAAREHWQKYSQVVRSATSNIGHVDNDWMSDS